ncbi:hypothetical protein D9758_010277 [Tetrapyrgos nigripes]|uniref:Uncharacterized protein n=1 Tax=Tetrapyrgos nigripes TaxID=182062 RepID=A0A8H5GAF0_9AGAR|nr:hypothetical protein D9758_010277 [Tetrapyrgos nigripes]
MARLSNGNDAESGVFYLVPNRNRSSTGPAKHLVRRPKPPLTSTALDEDFDAVTQDCTTVYTVPNTQGGVDEDEDGDEEDEEGDRDTLGEMRESELLRPRPEREDATKGLLNGLKRNGNVEHVGNGGHGGVSNGVHEDHTHLDGTDDARPYDRHNLNQSRRSTWAPTAPIDDDFDAWTFEAQTVFTTGTAAHTANTATPRGGSEYGEEGNGTGEGGRRGIHGIPTNAIGRIIEEDRYEDGRRSWGWSDKYGHQRQGTGSSSTVRQKGQGQQKQNEVGVSGRNENGNGHGHSHGTGNGPGPGPGPERTHEFFVYEKPEQNQKTPLRKTSTSPSPSESRTPSPTTLTLTRTDYHHHRDTHNGYPHLNSFRSQAPNSRLRPSKRRVYEPQSPTPPVPPIPPIPTIPSIPSMSTRRNLRPRPPIPSYPNAYANRDTDTELDGYTEPGVYIHNDVFMGLDGGAGADGRERERDRERDRGQKRERQPEPLPNQTNLPSHSQALVKPHHSSSSSRQTQAGRGRGADEFGRLERLEQLSGPSRTQDHGHAQKPTNPNTGAIRRRRGPLPAAQNYQVVDKQVIEDGPERTVEIAMWREGVMDANVSKVQDRGEGNGVGRVEGGRGDGRGRGQAPDPRHHKHSRSGGSGGGGGGGSRDWGYGYGISGNGISGNRISGNGFTNINVTGHRRNGSGNGIGNGTRRRSEVSMSVYYVNADDYALDGMDDDEALALGVYDWRTGKVAERVEGEKKSRENQNHRSRPSPRWTESEDVSRSRDGFGEPGAGPSTQTRNRHHNGGGVIDRPQTPWPSQSEFELGEYEGEDESSNPHRHHFHGSQRHEQKLKQKPSSLSLTRIPHQRAENGYNGDMIRTSTPIHSIPRSPTTILSPRSPRSPRFRSRSRSPAATNANTNTTTTRPTLPPVSRVLATCDPPLTHLTPTLMELGILTEDHLRAVAKLKGETRDRELRDAALKRGVTIMEWAILVDRLQGM